jgi:hypothetical protein
VNNPKCPYYEACVNWDCCGHPNFDNPDTECSNEICPLKSVGGGELFDKAWNGRI